MTDCPCVQNAFNKPVSVGAEESCAWVTPIWSPYTKREEVAVRVLTMLQFWTSREKAFFSEKDITKSSHFEGNKEPAHSEILSNQ